MPRNLMLASVWVGSVGCFGDFTSSNGEFGRLSYGLVTDYEAGADELTEVPLLTGYEHFISVRLTGKGQRRAKDRAGDIEHRGEGVGFSPAGDTVPDLWVQVDEPGPSVIQSILREDLFDRITLTFADPTALELATWVRSPWEDKWRDQPGTGPLTIEEGTQLSFVAIPMADDVRLAGEFTPAIEVDVPGLAVPDVQVLAVQEGGITEMGEPVTFFAIEPGTVTFTFVEPVHGVTVDRVVEIVPFGSR